MLEMKRQDMVIKELVSNVRCDQCEDSKCFSSRHRNTLIWIVFGFFHVTDFCHLSNQL